MDPVLDIAGDFDLALCRAKPCDTHEKCHRENRCTYKSSAEESNEVRARVMKEMNEGFGAEIAKAVIRGSAGFNKTILHEAYGITGEGGERNDSYDHPRPNFEKIAQAWEVIFGCKLTAEKVALAMIVMKCVRENHKHKRDNLVDIAGYARCIERLEEEAR